MVLRHVQPVWEQWWLFELDGAVWRVLWAQGEQSADPAWELEESLQSGIDGIAEAHLSLSCVGAIPHRYYWFPPETSSITEWLWPDEPTSIAEQRHSSLVMLYHQVNFRTYAYLKAVLFLNVIHIPLVCFKWAFCNSLERPDLFVLITVIKGEAVSFFSLQGKYLGDNYFFKTTYIVRVVKIRLITTMQTYLGVTLYYEHKKDLLVLSVVTIDKV